jgi:PleD family two-component response regulator
MTSGAVGAMPREAMAPSVHKRMGVFMVKNPGAIKAFQRRRVGRSYAGATKIESLNWEEQTGKENVRLEEGRREPARSAFHIRILSIDGHPLFREGIGALINSQADMSLVSAVETGKEGIDAYRATKPDVTLLDLQLSDISGIEVLIGIRSEFPDARIIILATFNGTSRYGEHSQ